MKTTGNGRVIELVLALLGNLLLDEVTLDEKEEIVFTCLNAFKMQALKEYLYEESTSNLSCMRSIVHTLSSMCMTLCLIDQDLAVMAETLIMEQLVGMLTELVDLVVREEGENPELWGIVGQILS